MARDGELMQTQHFCHHGDTICHPNSSLTIKLYGTSTCGCNNNAIFQNELFSDFLPSAYAGYVDLAVDLAAAGLGDSCQSDKMVTLINSLFFMFKISLLPKYCVKYYEYNCKVMQWCSM